jgi:uncharacterized protein (DUF433 family)
MDWRRRIVANPDVFVGMPVIKGTRISVELAMELLAAGYTTDQIIEQYDHRTRETSRPASPTRKKSFRRNASTP